MRVKLEPRVGGSRGVVTWGFCFFNIPTESVLWADFFNFTAV
jgi:hypothetical protein